MRSHAHPKIFLFLASKNKNSTHRMIKPKTAFIFSAVVFIALNKLKILAIQKIFIVKCILTLFSCKTPPKKH